MHTKEHFLRMFRFDDWANRECLAALRAAHCSDPKLLRLLTHTLAAEKLWLERMRRQPQMLPVWPTHTLEECGALADELGQAWREYIGGLSAEEVHRTVQYRNSKGELWSSRVEDVLTHVLMHSTYHRGQLALAMRAAGLQPAYTDFIHAVRQGFVK